MHPMDTSWACLSCTLMNNSYAAACSMCYEPRLPDQDGEEQAFKTNLDHETNRPTQGLGTDKAQDAIIGGSESNRELSGVSISAESKRDQKELLGLTPECRQVRDSLYIPSCYSVRCDMKRSRTKS